MWLSSVCITSRMIVRRDQCRGAQQLQRTDRVAPQRGEPLDRPRHVRPVADERRVEQRHAVAGLAVADGLDVRVGVGVDRAADRDALGQVDRVVRRGHREDRLGVRAHDGRRGGRRSAAASRRSRQRCSSLFVPSAPGADHDAACAGAPGGPCAARPRALGDDLVALGPVGRRRSAGCRPPSAPGETRTPQLLGEPEVVLDQRVLRAVAGSRPCSARSDRQPVRAGPSPPKYGSSTVTPGSPKNTPTRVLAYVSLAPMWSPNSRSRSSAASSAVTARDAEHPLGLVVVRRQRRAPSRRGPPSARRCRSAGRAR